jgi:hypothetical protein
MERDNISRLSIEVGVRQAILEKLVREGFLRHPIRNFQNAETEQPAE